MAKQPYAFINYRRTDASAAARGLHVQLRVRFGSRVFMDVASLTPGDIWPERLNRELLRATVMLIVIGPGWLTSADAYGRRRIDQPTDWVRQEVSEAIRL